MGNVIEIEGYFKERLENIGSRKQKLIAEKEILEKRLEEINRIKKEGQTADRYFDDEILEIGVEIDMIDEELKCENHNEYKSKEKIVRYQRKGEKEVKASEN
jgi:hypothetical protein